MVTFAPGSGITVNIRLEELSTDARIDLLNDLLRKTGIAYQPAMKDAMETIKAFSEFYTSPTNETAAKVEELNRLARAKGAS